MNLTRWRHAATAEYQKENTMTDITPDFPAVPGSIPFVHNVDTAPAYWWLDILWIILVKGEDTGGRYSLV